MTSDPSAQGEAPAGDLLTFPSVRFGDLTVPSETIIDFPLGIIGFAQFRRYVLLEHRHPFSWLHSVDNEALAFVVVDGFDLGKAYDLSLPFACRECDFRPEDEYAILIIVTVRPDPRQTTANVKAPLFINVRNRRGVQVVYDDPLLSTRAPLWLESPSATVTEDSRHPLPPGGDRPEAKGEAAS